MFLPDITIILLVYQEPCVYKKYTITEKLAPLCAHYKHYHIYSLEILKSTDPYSQVFYDASMKKNLTFVPRKAGEQV